MTKIDKNSLTFMIASLKEAQDTIRAYDTKAQIVGVGYIFAMGIIFSLGRGIDNTPEMSAVTVTLAWLFIIFPIAMFGSVIYPSRKFAAGQGQQGSHANGTFYVEPEQKYDVDTYLEAVNSSDPKKEIAFEILRCVGLRESKRRRFLYALWSAAVSFFVMFLGQILRTKDLLPL